MEDIIISSIINISSISLGALIWIFQTRIRHRIASKELQAEGKMVWEAEVDFMYLAAVTYNISDA